MILNILLMILFRCVMFLKDLSNLFCLRVMVKLKIKCQQNMFFIKKNKSFTTKNLNEIKVQKIVFLSILKNTVFELHLKGNIKC